MNISGRRREEVKMFRSRGTAAKLYFAGRMAVRLPLTECTITTAKQCVCLN